MEKVNKCPICKSKNLTEISSIKFEYPGNKVEENILDSSYVRLWIIFQKIVRDKKKVSFFINKCTKCGFLFLNPRYSEKEIEVKYETINKLRSVSQRIRTFPALKIKKRSNRIYNLIDKKYPRKYNKTPKILDYGGSLGHNLEAFLNEYDSFILDYQRLPINHKIKYLGKTLNDLNRNKKFDIILLTHTLEHIIKPKRLIKKLSRHLSNRGLIYIEVPLGCAFEWKYLSNPLTHINFFSEESLFKCLKLVNLDIIYIKTNYQLVTHRKMWCINIIAQKKSLKPNIRKISRIHSTEFQMSFGRLYYLYALFSELMDLKGEFFKSLSKKFKTILNLN